MKTKFEIIVENSAPSQRIAAKSVVWAASVLHNLGVTSVVDIGCGRLRNLKILQRFFSDITLVDTKLQCERIKSLVPKKKCIRLVNNESFKANKRKFHAAFIISVLHTIPDRKRRESIIAMVTKKLDGLGYIVIDVPSSVNYYKEKCNVENKYRDGWLMGNGVQKTFYKNYNAKELDDLLTKKVSLELYKKVWFEKHLVRIMKKMNK